MDEQQKLKTILDKTIEPASAAVDGRSVSQRPLDDVIDALRYAAAVQAEKHRFYGLRFIQLQRSSLHE